MVNNRDINILEHIIKYCDEILMTIDSFSNDYEEFSNNSIYQNATALCVLQIGELTTHFSEEFKVKYNKLPWHQMKAMRNVVAHNYGNIDTQLLWETLNNDIPELKDYCCEIINTNKY